MGINLELLKNVIEEESLFTEETTKRIFDEIEKIEKIENSPPEIIVFSYPGSDYYVDNLTDLKALDYLDELAEECWPGEGDWPRNDGDYPSYVINIEFGYIEQTSGGRFFEEL